MKKEIKTVALYGRYSTKKQNKESADDQLRMLRELCKRNGWRVVAEFKDEGHSGGTARRPAYQQLCEMVRRGECDAVVVEESKRLWRAMREQATRLDEWFDLGVHLVTASGIDTRDPNARMALGMMGAMAEQDLKECRYRIRRGLKARAQENKPTGGRCYGYFKANGGINKAEAKVVTRIFRDYLSGLSDRSIAHALNRDGVPSPGASWAGRDGKWRQSGVRGTLRNRRYLGEVTWGAYEVIRAAGDSSKRKYVPTTEEPITHVRSDLRIIDDATFRAAQKRSEAALKLHKAKGKRGGPRLRHALSGLLRCAKCNGSFVISNGRSYSCATHRSGGEHACSVADRVRKDVVEKAIFGAISDHLLAPEFLAEFTAWFNASVKKSQQAAPDNAKRLAAVQRKIDNLIRAIADGTLRASKDVTAQQRLLEDERDALAAQQVRPASNVVSLMPRLQEWYKKPLRDLPALAARDPDRARALLQTLTGGMRVIRTKAGLAAEMRLTGERLAAFAGVGSCGGAGGGT